MHCLNAPTIEATKQLNLIISYHQSSDRYYISLSVNLKKLNYTKMTNYSFICCACSKQSMIVITGDFVAGGGGGG